jgi:hypothetical protein
MATTTNYTWETPDDTDLVKDGAAAIRTLGSSIDTTTKALNPSTTLGDIEYRSATANTNTRLGIGTTGQVLTVAGGVPSWATASSGGLTLLSTTTLSSTTTTISSISGSYKNLLVVVKNIVTSTEDSLRVRFNTDTGSNYTIRQVDVTGSTVSCSTSTVASVVPVATTDDTNFANKGSLIMNLYRYTDTSLIDFDMNGVGFDGTNRTGRTIWGRYGASAAITSITFLTDGATFTTGTVYIYGVN